MKVQKKTEQYEVSRLTKHFGNHKNGLNICEVAKVELNIRKVIIKGKQMSQNHRTGLNIWEDTKFY